MKARASASLSAHNSHIQDNVPGTTARDLRGTGFGHDIFRVSWYGINILLFVALVAVLWTAAWEYSTECYLRGFSDAIIPFSAAPAQKVQAILNWMGHTPARFDQAPESMVDDRDPTDTLNYASLLSVCGTATNAFLNLADTGGLTVRRLLLLDANRTTVHVVAEVLIDGRWIVVDPVFHTIFRGADGGMLTRQQLVSSAVFRAATQNIPDYLPTYTFDRAVHVRLSHFGPIGQWVRDKWGVPSWADRPVLSLMLERKSLELFVVFVFAALCLLILRGVLRWYGEACLGIRTERMHRKLFRLGLLFLEPAD
ncbi:MAG TPA: transglutaminase domain-containing protein [Candidatus Acidoferrales bacterium]|nr:transglutaminase domain-containing protein [Candidatus Acidoferrales bacterium]